MDLQCTKAWYFQIRIPYRTTAVHGIALTPLHSSSYISVVKAACRNVVPPLEMFVETDTDMHMHVHIRVCIRR